jgi:hypothetical protein
LFCQPLGPQSVDHFVNPFLLDHAQIDEAFAKVAPKNRATKTAEVCRKQSTRRYFLSPLDLDAGFSPLGAGVDSAFLIASSGVIPYKLSGLSLLCSGFCFSSRFMISLLRELADRLGLKFCQKPSK